jgi:GlpG protein
MRLIGHIKSEAGARTFGAYLSSIDAPNLVEPEGDGTWAVWIYNEDQIEASQLALATFQANPALPQFKGAEEKAAVKAAAQRKREKAVEKRTFNRDSIWPQMSLGPVTIVLLAASVVGYLLVKFAPEKAFWLMFLPSEIARGQIWRAVTPIFLHFSILHVLFNVLMLRDLGGLLESRFGSWRLIYMTVILALASNFCQYFEGGPGFGGMSGVLYGYFGYLWIRGRVDPDFGLYLAPNIVAMMLGWLALCFTGLMGNVANWAHLGGLAAGMAWGALPLLGSGRK